MANADDVQALVCKLDALHTRLLQAWNTASDGEDDTKTATLKTQSDHAGEQLLVARQRLLSAIDNDPDVSKLMVRIGEVTASIEAAQQSISDQTGNLTQVSTVLDGVDQLIRTTDNTTDA